MASPLFKTTSTLKTKKLKPACPASHQCREAMYAADRLYGRHCYRVVWDCLDGWNLTDMDVKVARYDTKPAKGLRQCPFCGGDLPVVNEVEIT